MKQVFRRVIDSSGKVRVEEVNAPVNGANEALIDVRASLISSGTERGTLTKTPVELAKLVLRDPWMRKAVMQMLSGSLSQTADKVMDELTLLREIGYSGAGVVAATGLNVEGLQTGQRVAYAAAGHADVVAVSKNLVVPVPAGIGFDEACFSTVGAIALNGVRKSGAKLGEWVVVIGLGLVGQLTSQILLAAGCRVIGIDVNDGKLASARDAGVRVTLNSATSDAVRAVKDLTGGSGADRVIICAQTQDSGPANQALNMCRPQGQVTFVGIVKMDLERMPFFRGELNLNFARAYGPGVMDAAWERGEADYPSEYVRFTARDNMADFLHLVAEGKADVKRFISARFPVEQAQEAYDQVIRPGSKAIAVVLEYGPNSLEADHPRPKVAASAKDGRIRTGLIGAGNFTRGFHLPNMKANDLCELHAVATRSGASAEHVRKRFGFRYATARHEALLSDRDIDLVYIGTRHNTHAKLAAAALAAGKAVLCEKPIALTLADLALVVAAQAKSGKLLTVGYNRRYAPSTQRLKSMLQPSPLVMQYTVSSGAIPADHWTLDPQTGGGRLLGEADHFFDLMCWLCGAAPRRISASARVRPHETPLTCLNFVVNVEFTDGSLGQLLYTDQGGAGQAREEIVVHQGGGSLCLRDFKKLEDRRYGRSKVGVKAGLGHAEELEAVLRRMQGEAVDIVGVDDILNATYSTQGALRSILEGRPVMVEELAREVASMAASGSSKENAT